MAKTTRVRRAGTGGWRPEDPATARPGTAAASAASAASSSRAADSRLLTALLPLRLFLGGTFLYAGLDKFLTPAFLREGGSGSIAQQLQGFTHSSPLTPLIQAVALPHPIVIGILIALAEIAVGIGLLLGIAYRLSALGGFLIGMLFFLTASWGTQPYYFGPDLPYAAGFLTLALVGRPGPYTIARSVDSLFSPVEPAPRRGYSRQQWREEEADFSPTRRAFLQSVVVGAAALVVGGAAFALTRMAGTDAGGGDSLPGGNGSGGGATATQGTGTGSGSSIGTVSQITQDGSLQFTDPSSGDPALAIQVNGQVQGYDATCTHQGCPVQYDPSQKIFACPCHGAEFDATNNAQVIAGPARAPLSPIKLTVDAQGNVFVG